MRQIIPLACCAVTTGLCAGLMMSSREAFAQVIPDGTLSTTVTQAGNNFAIDNGDRLGNNLFHSFSQFSVPTGGSAIFNNAADIQNIFSRVTGGGPSNIDGLIQANGAASLFLLNPSGILFGPNARLNIGGSLITTTANSVQFADGVEFSAVDPTTPPLLTMSVPIGLQFGQTPGDIQQTGSGHTLSQSFFTAPLVASGVPNALSTNPGRTLAFLGGNIVFKGGVLSANGQLEVSALGRGAEQQVGLLATAAGWSFDYREVSSLGTISLSQQALIDGSGAIPGKIHLRGGTLQMTDSSVVLMNNTGPDNNIGIQLDFTGDILLQGATASNIRSGIYSYTNRAGNGAPIEVTANRISMNNNGGFIGSQTFGTGNAGNVSIQASSIELVGGNRLVGRIHSFTLGSGAAGDITIDTNSLKVSNGGVITANVNTGASGLGGRVTINATDSIELTGAINAVDGSLIGASTLGSGNARGITLNTRRLAIRDGAGVSSSAFAGGSAGFITINALESVILSSNPAFIKARGESSSSFIRSGTILVDSAIRTALGLPNVPTGAAGTIRVNTPYLEVADASRLTVRNDGTGNAGDLSIQVGTLALRKRGEITATTASGEGGNIFISARDLIFMRSAGLINTEAQRSGNGGNITLLAPVILGLENSDIIANAFQGRGGNVNITTQDLIGLEFRNTLTPRADITNDITASSQFNVNGTVQINSLGVDPKSGLMMLPANLTDPSQKLAQGCAANQGSSFMVTGRGGVPLNPMTQTSRDRPWTDTRNLAPYRGQPVTYIPQSSIPAPLVEATGWRRNTKGDVEVYAATGTTFSPANTEVTCAKSQASTASARP